MRIAAGDSLGDLGLSQEMIRINGAALQCRITTEDPANDFRPDTGTITAYRPAGGAGVRIDGGTVDIGVDISAYFDSLLVKLICHGRDFESAVTRARRALAEFRIRGVSTNIPFLQAVLADPDFMAGDASTSFIEERPDLLTAYAPADRGTKLLRWLAEVTVNQPHGPAPTQLDPGLKRPTGINVNIPSPQGSRQRLLDLGPEAFAADLRQRVPVEVTDTTFRDAHQSLLATRVRTKDLIRIAPYVGRMTPELLSVECWGGATYDVALRFIAEDPWERLAALRYNMPGLCLQMLLRGRNTVGYTPYPTKVTTSFVAEAAEVGIDIFRIFDALNDVEQMRPAIEAVRETGSTLAEVALCYTGDLNSPTEDLYTLDYYLRLAEKMVQAGAHIIGIKDMAGLLRPPAARKLVTALRRNFELPVHLHTHDTAGGQLATLLAAIDVGVDAVDVASAPMAGTTSQVPASALVAACANTERPTNLDLRAVMELEPYWEAVRKVYAPFESGLPSPTGRVYDHEIPGGQLSNLRQQAIALGLGEKFEQIEAMYTAANKILGRPPKVTPSSKVVGDLALHLVAVGADPDDFAENPQKYDIPDSVIGFLNGELGDPPGGWPEPFRTKALQGRTVPVRDIELSAEDSADLDDKGLVRQSTLNRLLFPGPTKDFLANRATYGDVGRLNTLDFLYGLQPGQEHVAKIGRGVSLILGLSAIGNADERGMRTVMCTINGQLRPIRVRDKSIKVDVKTAERADPNKPGHVAAPFAGVVTVTVHEGDQVQEGATVATIEAMKMEAAITAAVSGVVKRLALADVQQVEGGDLVLVIASA
jgi:pyruvate carboxylase